MNSSGPEPGGSDPVVNIYKQRLEEVENAFCYNLRLLADRDLELDVMEEQLMNRTEQLRRAAVHNTELRESVKRIEEERLREARSFRSQLSSKESIIRDLDRKNRVHFDTLRQTLENASEAQEHRMQKLESHFEKRRCDLEREFERRLENHQKKHLAEMIETEKDLKALKDKILDWNQKLEIREAEFCRQMEEPTLEYDQAGAGLQDIIIQTEVPDKDTESGRKSRATQTTHAAYRNEEGEYKKVQNRSSVDECNAVQSCSSCSVILTELRETSATFQRELGELKKLLQEEQQHKNEQETVMEGLEESIANLKEKLLLDTQLDTQQHVSEECACGCFPGVSQVDNTGVWNEIRVTLLEQQLAKMETFLATAQQERQVLLDKMETMRNDCLEKIEKCIVQESSCEINTENLLGKIRLEISKLESKIESDTQTCNEVVKKNTNNKISRTGPALRNTKQSLNNSIIL